MRRTVLLRRKLFRIFSDDYTNVTLARPDGAALQLRREIDNAKCTTDVVGSSGAC